MSIYGSCVSRDTLEFVSPESYALKRYIARQSLISAFYQPTLMELDLSALESNFQRRMVTGDLTQSLQQSLPAIAKDSDLLLWDLIDERLGVYRTEDGGYITRSFELIKSGNDEPLQQSAQHIPFGSDEHFELWTVAFSRFLHEVDSLGCREKVKLLAVPWAETDDEGRPAPWSQGLPPKTANKMYERYYRAAGEDLTVVRVGQRHKPRASVEHRWGLAPFHYGERTYREIADALAFPFIN